MSLDLYLDPVTNDLELDAYGELRLVGDDPYIVELGQTSTEGEAISQRLRVRLQTHLREWYLDQRVGVDYLGVVFVRDPDLIAVRAELLREITAVEGVGEVVSITLDWDQSARELAYRFQVITDDGLLDESGILPDLEV